MQITRILLYSSAVELGFGERSDGKWAIFEGPVIDGKPHRWLEVSSDVDALRQRCMKRIEDARRHL